VSAGGDSATDKSLPPAEKPYSSRAGAQASIDSVKRVAATTPVEDPYARENHLNSWGGEPPRPAGWSPSPNRLRRPITSVMSALVER
jgi:Domain of unknown function (DUF1508)